MINLINSIGPFHQLDAEAVKEEADIMWRTLYKLSRTLMDMPGSKRIADTTRGKVEKFRQCMPLLQILCTPGLKERHWLRVNS